MSYLQKYVSKNAKYIYAKPHNIITNKKDAKAITENVLCDYKCKFNSTISNSKQKCNIRNM